VEKLSRIAMGKIGPEDGEIFQVVNFHDELIVFHVSIVTEVLIVRVVALDVGFPKGPFIF